MRHSETVTFGGSGLDRAAHMRGDSAQIAALLADKATRIIPVWRGKLLTDMSGYDHLVRLPVGHQIFAKTTQEPIFLGLDAGAPVFAADISGWQPEGLDDAAMAAFLDTSEQHHPAVPKEQVFVELRSVMANLCAMDAELFATARSLFEWHRSHKFCASCGVKSSFTMAGWQRDCEACGRKHFPRTDPVVIMLITRGNSVLIGRSPQWPEGMYSLLAGFIEPGETIEAAVRREVFEEAGIKVGDVSYLASQPWPFPSSLMIGCHGEAISENITIDPIEIEEARWMSREEMLEVYSDQHAQVKPLRQGAIAHFILRHWLADSLD